MTTKKKTTQKTTKKKTMKKKETTKKTTKKKKMKKKKTTQKTTKKKTTKKKTTQKTTYLDGRAVDEGRVFVDGDDEEGNARDARDDPDGEHDAQHVSERALVARQQRPADGVVALEADGEDREHGAEGDCVLQERLQFTCDTTYTYCTGALNREPCVLVY